jgi:hypothetical protein
MIHPSVGDICTFQFSVVRGISTAAAGIPIEDRDVTYATPVSFFCFTECKTEACAAV